MNFSVVPKEVAQTQRRRALISELKSLHSRYGTFVGSNYDISDECNLSCEGCLYFSGLAYQKRGAVSQEDWQQFFRKEAERGVNFGYFAGAEPSLVPEALRAAHGNIRYGVIFSNGIKRVPEDIRYRVHLSLWGGAEDNQKFRGADNTTKALRNYEGDDRAVAVYTINRKNIEGIVPVSQLCAEHGIPITYSYFTPTDDYLARLNNRDLGNTAFFRTSSKADHLMLGRSDFQRAAAEIEKAMELCRDFVLYSSDYNDWVTQEGGVYSLNEKGVATDCGYMLSRGFKHFNVDLSINSGKCCLPNLDCGECRAYATSYATYMSRLQQFRKSDDLLEQWLSVRRIWLRLFLLPEQMEALP